MEPGQVAPAPPTRAARAPVWLPSATIDRGRLTRARLAEFLIVGVPPELAGVQRLADRPLELLQQINRLVQRHQRVALGEVHAAQPAPSVIPRHQLARCRGSCRRPPGLSASLLVLDAPAHGADPRKPRAARPSAAGAVVQVAQRPVVVEGEPAPPPRPVRPAQPFQRAVTRVGQHHPRRMEQRAQQPPLSVSARPRRCSRAAQHRDGGVELGDARPG